MHGLAKGYVSSAVYALLWLCLRSICGSLVCSTPLLNSFRPAQRQEKSRWGSLTAMRSSSSTSASPRRVPLPPAPPSTPRGRSAALSCATRLPHLPWTSAKHFGHRLGIDGRPDGASPGRHRPRRSVCRGMWTATRRKDIEGICSTTRPRHHIEMQQDQIFQTHKSQLQTGHSQHMQPKDLRDSLARVPSARCLSPE